MRAARVARRERRRQQRAHRKEAARDRKLFGVFGRPLRRWRQLLLSEAVAAVATATGGAAATVLDFTRSRARRPTRRCKWGRCEVCDRPLVVIGRQRKNGRTDPVITESTWNGNMFVTRRHKKCMKVEIA
jgi:hypothetical protein